ncbi:MAG: TonB-dependent receptor plug domain-containing protein [Cyanobacteria bacterium P01_D01_bin.116]
MGETAIPKVELFDSDKALIFSFAPVEAQKPAAQTEDVTIELIVTAEKSEENIQDVPISITAISEQQLEDAQVDSIQDIAKNTPNFSFDGYQVIFLGFLAFT